jgi:hypothetical protein
VTITAVESRSIPADQLFLLSDIVLFPFWVHSLIQYVLKSI